MCSASNVFPTATSVISDASRPASAAAIAIWRLDVRQSSSDVCCSSRLRKCHVATQAWAMKSGRSLAEALGRLQRAPASRVPRLFMMTDAERLPDPLRAAATVPPGSAIILRHYGDSRRARLAATLSGIARRRGLKLLIADSPELAKRVGAAGVHWPEHRIQALVRSGRRLPRLAGGLATAAAHSPAAMHMAHRVGADAVVLSPAFRTASHPDTRPIGAEKFRRWVRGAPLPVIALGGIDSRSLALLNGCGLHGAAAIGVFADR